MNNYSSENNMEFWEKFALPISIVVAAVLVSGTMIYWVGASSSPTNSAGTETDEPHAMDDSEFATCIDEGRYSDLISQDRSAAQAVGVNSTPTSYVNGRQVRGALPYQQFTTIIEQELGKVEGGLEYTPTGELALTDRDIVLGDPNAPVTFIEYGDYQCPFCGRFFTQVEQPLREDYIETGQVKMVFRNFQFLGAESTAAAEAAECAAEQGKFWDYHDALYSVEIQDGREHNGNLNRETFLDIAEALKLN